MPHTIVKALFDHIKETFPEHIPGQHRATINFGRYRIFLRVNHDDKTRNIHIGFFIKRSKYPRAKLTICPDGTVQCSLPSQRTIPGFGLSADEPDFSVVTATELAVCVAEQLVPFPQHFERN